jgi:hypothetical protein
MSQPKRAITKSMSMSTKSQSFGGEIPQLQAPPCELYSNQCNIWSSTFSSSNLTWNPWTLSTPSSSTSSLGTFSSSSSSSSSVNSPQTTRKNTVLSRRERLGRQLPSAINISTKTGDEINKCVERNKNKEVRCSFCQNNGECEYIWRSHSIKDLFGKITCPLLMAYTCPICGESGEKAHTITYCKMYKINKIGISNK